MAKTIVVISVVDGDVTVQCNDVDVEVVILDYDYDAHNFEFAEEEIGCLRTIADVDYISAELAGRIADPAIVVI